MKTLIEKYQGIHPGLVLEHELKKWKLSKRGFKIALKEHPQTLNKIIKARRGITIAQSLKIDNALNFKEGTMFLLQAYYEIVKEKEKNNTPFNNPIIRKMIFWDTDISKIDWRKQYKVVIERVFEKGNEEEKMNSLIFMAKKR